MEDSNVAPREATQTEAPKNEAADSKAAEEAPKSGTSAGGVAKHKEPENKTSTSENPNSGNSNVQRTHADIHIPIGRPEPPSPRRTQRPYHWEESFDDFLANREIFPDDIGLSLEQEMEMEREFARWAWED